MCTPRRPPVAGKGGSSGACRVACAIKLESSRRQVARTRALLEAGRPLTRALPLRLGLELKFILAGGLRILTAIDAVRGDVFRRRPQLRRRDWVAMSASALMR